MEIMKQKQYAPLSVEQEVAVLYALTRGHLDHVPVEKMGEWEEKFLEYLETDGDDFIAALGSKKALDEEIEEMLKKHIETFKKSFSA